MKRPQLVFNIFLGILVIIAIGITIYFNDSIIITLSLLCVILFIKNIYKNKRYKRLYRIAEVNNRRYKMALEALNGAVWEWDNKSQTVYMSNRMKRILKVNKEIESLNQWFDFFTDDKEKEDAKLFYKNICEKKNLSEFNIDHFITNSLGESMVVEVQGKGKIKDNTFYLSGIITDITERKKQELILKERERKHRLVVEGSKDIIFCWDLQSNNVAFDNKIIKYLDYETKDDLIISNSEWSKYIVPKDIEKYNLEMQRIVNSKIESYYEIDYRIKCRNNKILWLQSKGKKSIDNNGKEFIYGSLCDITDRKEKEIEVKHLSYYDEVTGMPNRRYFIDSVTEIIKKRQGTDERVAFIFIDLDNFKYVNDTYGHDVGDALLIKFSELINELSGKESFIARFGGDEFILAKYNIKDKNEVTVILDNIIKTLSKPININDKEVFCTLSIGVSIYPSDGKDITTLLKRADMAMYTAKENGKNRYKFFDMSILESLNREFEIEKGLRSAIINNEINLVYQPKIRVNSEEVIGYECLARWTSSKLGFIPPKEFIPIAESSRIIVDIGKYIIEECFKHCKDLSLKTDKKFKMAINLSDVQIRDEEIVRFVDSCLKKYNLSPEYIEFEITESIIMKSVQKNIEILQRLKELGITLALDDFGTGYSSLNYLRILPIDVLKIDKSFIDGINIDDRSEHIIQSIVELSHYFKLLVVAEGVETIEQLKYLKEVNCDIIQGYYYSKPKFFEEASKMILN
ncbi:hypothetical protein JCM1393_02280 [Clostridium carnis]